MLLENTFYQYLDEENVLQESLFMPLGALSLIAGLLILSYAAIKQAITWVAKR